MFYKTKKTKAVVFVIVIFLIFTSNVYAFDIGNESINKIIETGNSAQTLAIDYVSFNFDGTKIIHKISTSNLEKCKLTLHNQGYSTSEINNGILLSLGYTNDDIESINQDEINFIISESSEIVTTERYVKVDNNGNLIEMSKGECLAEVYAYNRYKQNPINSNINGIMPASASGNSGYNDESINGWMRIITSASYISQGWYYISGTFKWLSMPNYRMIDAMSLFASYCAWSQNNSDYYSTFTHKYFNYYGNSTTVSQTKTTQDRVLNQEGVYYKWDLPESSFDPMYGTAYSVYYMNFYVRGKCRVSNYTNPTAFNVYTRYEHSYSTLHIQPSFTWKLGSWPGVGINASIFYSSDLYYSLCYVDYTP